MAHYTILAGKKINERSEFTVILFQLNETISIEYSHTMNKKFDFKEILMDMIRQTTTITEGQLPVCCVKEQHGIGTHFCIKRIFITWYITYNKNSI